MSKTVLLLLSLLVLSLSSPSLSSPHHQQEQQQQLSDFISSLLATTDFQTWASLLLNLLPLNSTATVFLPNDAAISHLPTFFDPFLIPYHIVPNLRLSSSHLRLLPPLSRLPTLLPHRSLLLSLSSNNNNNLSVNHSPLSRPDLFLSPSFAVHGIPNVLLYSLRPDADSPNATSDGVFLSPPLPPPVRPEEVEVGSVWVSRAYSDTARADIVFFLLVFFFWSFGD